MTQATRARPRVELATSKALAGGVIACGAWATALGAVALVATGLDDSSGPDPPSHPFGARLALGLVAGGLGLIALQLGARRVAALAGALTAALAMVGLAEGGPHLAASWELAGGVVVGAPLRAAALLLAGAGLFVSGARLDGGVRQVAGLLGVAALALAALALAAPRRGVELALAPEALSAFASSAAGVALLAAGLVALGWAHDAHEGPSGAYARRVGFAAAALGALGSALGWNALVGQELARAHTEVADNAARLRRELAFRLGERVEAFARLAERWGALPRGEAAGWALEATSAVVEQPGYRSVRWLTADGHPAAGAAHVLAAPVATTAPSPALQALLQEAARAGGVVASPRVAYPEGGQGCLLVAPLRPRSRGTAAGASALLGGSPLRATAPAFLVAELDVGALLSDLERHQRELGYLFALSLEGEPLIAPASVRPAYDAAWGREGAPLGLAGRAWSARCWPDPAALVARGSPLPELALGAGLLLSLALALTGSLALRERERLNEAEAARAALEREVDERRVIEARLVVQAERLEHAALALAQSNQDLEEFAYVAAHDLRSPLRAIQNLSEWIEEDLGAALSGEARENMELLRARVQRMERLLDSLLQYSRAGRRAYAVEQVDTRQLVESAWDLAGEQGFELSLRGELPALTAPRHPLEQVLLNLLDNAVKHHDRERGRVEVIAEPALEEGAVAITVRDDGPGIPPEFHARVFGMFKTLRPRDKVEGSGIGLALVKRIVNRYGGQVAIVSGAGRGTAVRFTWPREPMAQA